MGKRQSRILQNKQNRIMKTTNEDKVTKVDITPKKALPYVAKDKTALELFLAKVKTNEYFLPYVGQNGGETSVVGFEDSDNQVLAAWKRDGDTAFLRSIQVIETGKGAGTAYMKDILAIAYNFNSFCPSYQKFTIRLEALTKRNEKWYRSLGFKKVNGGRYMEYQH